MDPANSKDTDVNIGGNTLSGETSQVDNMSCMHSMAIAIDDETRLRKATRTFFTVLFVLIDMALISCLFVLYNTYNKWSSILTVIIVAWLSERWKEEYSHMFFDSIDVLLRKIRIFKEGREDS